MHVNLSFVDFPSAFNCMQPHILACRLSELSGIDIGCIWLVDFLTVSHRELVLMTLCLRAWRVLQHHLRGSFCCSCYLCCNDSQSMFESRFIIRLADVSVIVSLLMDHEVGWDSFIKWSDESYLQLSVSKTKEIIDFRWNLPVTACAFVNKWRQ